MEGFNVENLSFTYPGRGSATIKNISFNVRQGELVLICGKSGCGKTTLLRLLKPSLSPFGEICGSIELDDKPLSKYDVREEASLIGFVMQNPDNQIVTDKVWHELSFGLESLGYSQNEIRRRVSEMATFFGIENWFYKSSCELSGGQKQLLNLASVMVMQPKALILDEPTSQLDPIAATELLNTIKKINRELGTTVILTEHRLEDAFPMADRVIVMDNGEIIADEAPDGVSEILKLKNHDMYFALPTPVRVHSAVENSLKCPLTVREGRMWLEEYSMGNPLHPEKIPSDSPVSQNNPVIEVKDAYFKYQRNLPDVIKGLTLSVDKGELFCIVGSNGTGKSTALSLLSCLNAPYRGEVLIKGQNASKIKNLYSGLLAALPQNPQSVFVKSTVYLDLSEMLSDKNISKEEVRQRVLNVSRLCRIEELLDRHPYDLSGGEQQRAALAKVILTSPEILLLDEPTKGMDAGFKEEFAEILLDLKKSGITVVMVSHDIEFCAKYADRCALMFDGSITSHDTPREFFKSNSFYTTSASRMARALIPDAVLAEDIILACNGNVRERKRIPRNSDACSDIKSEKLYLPEKKKLTPLRITLGTVFSILFIVTSLLGAFAVDALGGKILGIDAIDIVKLIAVFAAGSALFAFFPEKKFGTKYTEIPQSTGKLSKRTVFAAFLILLLIPMTLIFGITLLDDRKYYIISIFVILETMIPFFMVFESRKPMARELVLISVLCGIAVAGRAAFFMIPQFKPVVAIVIIAGICFGGETGFLVGGVTGFVSNFFAGQGPWTPWQMFAFGIIGFLAGVIFKKGFVSKTRLSLCVFGFLSTLIIYGVIMNCAHVIMSQNTVTHEMIVSAIILGLPFDLIHALSTAFFLWFIAEPMVEKLERVKLKYGLLK